VIRSGRISAVFQATGAPQSWPASAEHVHQSDDITGQMQHGVGLGVVGTAGPAVSALVGRDRVIAGRCERNELMTPGVPGLGKAMEQDNERPGAGLGDVHGQAANIDDTVGYAINLVLARRHGRRIAAAPG
jgi:hypothetical protein